MPQPAFCAECGAPLGDGRTCRDDFYAMLGWEWEYQLLDVHHLMVLSFNVQHPSILSPDGLNASINLLRQFLEEGISPEQMRNRMSTAVDSGTRAFTITAREEAVGSYAQPITWTMTAHDVIRAGAEQYYESVRRWAESIHAALKSVENEE